MENARSGCKRDCDKSTTEQRDNDLDEKELERFTKPCLTIFRDGISFKCHNL